MKKGDRVIAITNGFDSGKCTGCCRGRCFDYRIGETGVILNESDKERTLVIRFDDGRVKDGCTARSFMVKEEATKVDKTLKVKVSAAITLDITGIRPLKAANISTTAETYKKVEEAIRPLLGPGDKLEVKGNIIREVIEE